MATWQSIRSSKRRYPKCRLREDQERKRARLQAKRERADALRMSRPAPLYPADAPAGSWCGELRCLLNGHLTVIDLHVPKKRGRRARCDSYEARFDGEVLTVGGLHAVARAAIAKVIPRNLPREAMATMEA